MLRSAWYDPAQMYDLLHDALGPGFEAVFAIAGLLAVAYLVLRQRN